MFLQNAWYVAGWDHEVGLVPRATRVLGQDIVLYRTGGGVAAALENRCPHRKLPLSMGRVREEHLECGYHGLRFNSAGACAHMPGVARIPNAVRVRSYPTVARHGLLWIWMGAPAAADPSTILHVAHVGAAGWARNAGGSMEVDCSYLHVTDNLLDPSHVAWVHQGSFGNAACEAEPVQVSETGDAVIAWRWLRDVPVAPFYAPFVGFQGNCDRLQHYEVRFPSHAIIRAVFVPAGVASDDAARHPQAMVMDSYNFMTPEEEGRTRYYWFQVRNFAPHDENVSKLLDEGVRAAFAEDRVILNAVERGFSGDSKPPISLPGDRAGITFRKRLDSKILAERARSATATAGASD